MVDAIIACSPQASSIERKIQVLPTNGTLPRLDGLSEDAIVNRVVAWVRARYLPERRDQAYESEIEEWKFSGREKSVRIHQDARDLVGRLFGDIIQDELIERVAEELYLVGAAWASRSSLHSNEPKDEYSYYGFARDGESVRRDSQYRIILAHNKMLQSLNELESIVRTIAPASEAIGGNDPPNDIGLPPYTESDDAAVRAAIAKLREQPIAPENPASAHRAANVLEETGTGILSFIKKVGSEVSINFAQSFGKSAGLAAGSGVVAFSFWQLLGVKLLAAAGSVGEWLHAINL
jgi:hypothetical protein